MCTEKVRKTDRKRQTERQRDRETERQRQTDLPKCMAIGRSTTCLICWLPAISVCAIGDSKTATFPQPFEALSFDMIGIALAAFCHVHRESQRESKREKERV